MHTDTTSPAFSVDALISIRRGQGLSRSQLAKAAQLDPSQLWRIETRKATPYDSTLGRLARALKVPVSALLTSPE
jgi:transcriptional regulator with XRE-family HTH domain